VKTLRQILAVARMEFRFSFRRSAPVVIMALIGLLVGAGILISQIVTIRVWSGKLEMTPEQTAKWTAQGFSIEEVPGFVQQFIGDTVAYSSSMAWILMIMLSLLLLPVAVIPVIPVDRVYGVMELLHCVPLTGARYLAGKVLGVFSAILLVAVSMLVLFFVVLEITLYASLHFFLSWSASLYFIKLSLMDGLPLLAFGTTIGVLTGVIFRSRRAAIFPGLIAGVLSVFFWLKSFQPPTRSMTFPPLDTIEYFLLQNYSSPAQEQVLLHYGINMDLLGIITPINWYAVMQVYVILFAMLVAFAIFARLWLYWKENF
jgi:hypothetical protein